MRGSLLEYLHFNSNGSLPKKVGFFPYCERSKGKTGYLAKSRVRGRLLEYLRFNHNGLPPKKRDSICTRKDPRAKQGI